MVWIERALFALTSRETEYKQSRAVMVGQVVFVSLWWRRISLLTLLFWFFKLTDCTVSVTMCSSFLNAWLRLKVQIFMHILLNLQSCNVLGSGGNKEYVMVTVYGLMAPLHGAALPHYQTVWRHYPMHFLIVIFFASDGTVAKENYRES
jgi:hypothetical protein